METEEMGSLSPNPITSSRYFKACLASHLVLVATRMRSCCRVLLRPQQDCRETGSAEIVRHPTDENHEFRSCLQVRWKAQP